MMKNVVLLLLCCFSFQTQAKIIYDIPSDTRHTVNRADGSEIVYYLLPPANTHKAYPIAIICEGSSLKGQLESIIRGNKSWGLHPRLHDMGIGVLTVEKRGIDGNHINENEFFKYYTRTNRFNDHKQIIDALMHNPPSGWNGKLIFIGGSEGGPLVISLTLAYPKQTLATVDWVGASSNSWPDELWDFFHHGSLVTRLEGVYLMPWSRAGLDKKFDEIKRNPTYKKWFAGMTYRYHADVFAEEKRNKAYPSIKTPLLVVTGTADSIINTSDDFVNKARTSGVPITYYRVNGMGHKVLDPKFGMVSKTLNWIQDQVKKG